nr:unnamed protein product [Callosobruchus analis]
MIWRCLSALGVGKLHITEGTVTAVKYVHILKNSLTPTIETLKTIFQ